MWRNETVFSSVNRRRRAALKLPRQMSVRSMLLATALVAGWLAAVRFVSQGDVPSQVFCNAYGFSLVAGQVLRPKRWRELSILTTCVFLAIALVLEDERDQVATLIGPAIAVSLLLGPPFGYLMGAFVALALTAIRALNPRPTFDLSLDETDEAILDQLENPPPNAARVTS